MKNKTQLMIIPLALALGACVDDSSDSDANTGSAISVITVSGGTLDLTGTWKTECYTSNSGTTNAEDVQESIVFSSAGTAEYSSNSFTSTDASCSSGQSLTRGYTANVAVQGTLAVEGWEDGMNAATTPATAQDSSALSNNESFTDLMFTLTILGNMGDFLRVGDKVQMGYIVDDTGSDNILYRVDNKTPQPSLASTADPFTKM